MTDVVWISAAMAIGLFLGVVTLPWRHKWSDSSVPVYLGLWVFTWPGLLIIGGASLYFRAWTDYLREAERRKHLPPQKPPKAPVGHNTVRATYLKK